MIVNREFDTVIVIGTYNRGHLLARSIARYDKVKNIAIVLMDDGSTDNTKFICDQAKTPVYYFYLGDKAGWRDSASYLNKGIKFALNDLKARYVFITHPEIIPGAGTIPISRHLASDNQSWVSCKGYYLTPDQQSMLDKQDWHNDLLSVRHLPNFYGNAISPEFQGNREYLPESIDKTGVWHSWIFGGGSAEFWRYFGGLTEFDTWGSIDIDLLNRRNVAGIQTLTPVDEQAIVVHQNHDDLGTPRDMDKCMAAVPHYTTKQQALKPELLG